mgnify:CR=1 FL=1
MAYRNNYTQQITGYPALIWLTLREMAINHSRIDQYLNQLFHVYSFTEATIPSKKAEKEVVDKWTEALVKIDKELDQALADYNPLWEDASFSPDEAEFRKRLYQILRQLNNLICDAKLIDREFQRTQETPNPLGDD